MPFFFYDPQRSLKIARPLTRQELLAQLAELPDEQDVFIAVLRAEHRGLMPYVRALRQVRDELELPASAGGYVPSDGPWEPDHNRNASPPSPSHGAFQIYSAFSEGSVLGQLLVIPSNYTPLASTSWLGREYWRWESDPWPDTFVLRPESMSSGDEEGWSGWVHGAFSAPSGTITPSGGTLYSIRLVLSSEEPPGTPIGCLWKRADGKLAWFALESALDSDELLATPEGCALVFQKITSTPSGFGDLWRYLADPVSL
jgi:hypothetical protein